MKLAVIFPGIGYHVDKPLLYYSRKIAKRSGYEELCVNYGGFESGVKGNVDKMRRSYESALSQSLEILKDTDFSKYEEVLFIAKSVGTVVAGEIAALKNIKPRFILYTPVEATFKKNFDGCELIVFHGTGDSWCDSNRIRSIAGDKRMDLRVTEGANHSLETGDIKLDIENLATIMKQTEEFILRTTSHNLK